MSKPRNWAGVQSPGVAAGPWHRLSVNVTLFRIPAMSRIGKVRQSVSSLLVVAVVAGCASLAPLPPEEAVRQRAQARWDALIAGEWSKAYRYMSPSYRALVEEKRYANQFGTGAAIVGADVVRVNCAEDRCTVRMNVRYKIALAGRSGEAGDTHFNETWILEDGEWWMSAKP